MIIWLDAQLPPTLADWINATFGVQAVAFRYLNLRDTADAEIFFAARKANALIMSKDSDFIALLERHGPPPQIIWLTMGNTSNDALRRILSKMWPELIELIAANEPLIEIGGP